MHTQSVLMLGEQHLVVVQIAVVAVVAAALAPGMTREAETGVDVGGFVLGCCDVDHSVEFMGSAADGLAAAVGGGEAKVGQRVATRLLAHFAYMHRGLPRLRVEGGAWEVVHVLR